MIRELLAIIIGIFALYFTKNLGVYPIIAMMFLIEVMSIHKGDRLSNISFIIGMFLCEGYFLYTGTGFIELEYFIYVGIYLLVRYKGKEWFVDNNVNGYLYLLFAVSVPIFIDFVTLLMGIKVDILLFVTLYLIFLRMTDWILKSKITVTLFAFIQIVSAFSLESFILQDDMKIYFVVGIVLWTISKWKSGGDINVSKLFVTKLFGKSSKGVY